MRSRNSAWCSAISAASRSMHSARSATGRVGQSVSSNALRADATARSMSASFAAGTKPIGSPVAGLTTSKRSVESGSCQPPS